MSLDIHQRIASDIRGVYPFVGLDMDLPYKLGGNWMVIEPDDYEITEFDKRVISETEYGGQGIEEKVLSIVRAPFFNNSDLTNKIKSYKPNLLLLKIPGPGINYDDLVHYFKNTLEDVALVISDTALSHKSLQKVTNVLDKSGLSNVKSENLQSQFGGVKYPFDRFYLYYLIPATIEKSSIQVDSLIKNLSKTLSESL